MFVGFDVPGRVLPDVDVVHHPGQHLVPAVLDPAFQGELHQLLARRGHVFEALAEGDYGEAGVPKVLAHLGRAHRSKAIWRMSNLVPSSSMNASMAT